MYDAGVVSKRFKKHSIKYHSLCNLSLGHHSHQSCFSGQSLLLKCPRIKQYVFPALAKKLQVAKASYKRPRPQGIIIKNRDVAINPVNWKMQDHGIFSHKYLTLLSIQGRGENCIVDGSRCGDEVDLA